MKVLFIGDIIGKAGRRAVRELLPRLIVEETIDLVIANGENAAGGFGIIPKVADELFDMGVNLISTGNHIWDKKEIVDYLESGAPIIRPGNYPPGSPGLGRRLIKSAAGETLSVINASGRVFMHGLDCPFRYLDEEVEEAKKESAAVLVDFHAEATSEKNAMGLFLDGRVSAVIGTHTHVQTSDERILSKRTAYITDVGMTGGTDSVIGMKAEGPLTRFLTGLPRSFEPAKGGVELQGAIVDIDAEKGTSRSIKRVKREL